MCMHACGLWHVHTWSWSKFGCSGAVREPCGHAKRSTPAARLCLSWLKMQQTCRVLTPRCVQEEKTRRSPFVVRVAWHSTEKDGHTSKRSIPKAAECPPSSAATRRRPSSQELKTRSDDDVESCKLCARSLKEPATQRGLSSAASSITARQHDGQRGAPSRCGVHATNSRPVRRSQPCQSK